MSMIFFLNSNFLKKTSDKLFNSSNYFYVPVCNFNLKTEENLIIGKISILHS